MKLLVKTRPDVSTKPTRSTPSRQTVTSEARGCTCGGTTPEAPKSIRPIVRPIVLRPGRLAVVERVTLVIKGLARVSPGFDNAEVVKWETVTFVGSLHRLPLRKMCW